MMKYLISDLGYKKIENFISGVLSSNQKLLLAFDFDGTLASIVDKPIDARMDPQVEAKLMRLSEKSTIAIISGRSMADIRAVLACFKPRYIIANHGIERDFESNYKFELSSALSQNWLQQLVDEYKILNYDGVELENKTFSLTIHYRKAKDTSLVERKIKNILAQLKPCPRIVTGKYVLNIVPKDSPHKGLALLDLMDSKHYSRSIYIGDDDTDEDVFDLEDERVFTVRVGQKKDSKATYYIKDQEEIGKFLDLLNYLIK